MGYDPNSTDSVLSRILQRMDAQDEALARIELGVTKTNGRVTTLEVFRTELRAKVALISAGISVVVGALWQWWLNRNTGS